jgi:leucyl-tRNA---protein transferase
VPSSSFYPLNLYSTPGYPCSYLPDQTATTQVVDPAHTMTPSLYSRLIDVGFRRSGEHVYRPRCRKCAACIPARVSAQLFQPSRAQKRVWRNNADLEINAVPPHITDEHFALYRRYMLARHPSSGMKISDPSCCRAFFHSNWCDTRFYEFRLEKRLLAVAVVDELVQGLSAVYTFFEPEQSARSLGVYAVLWQIGKARQSERPWLYLGYWISSCPAMSYKNRYRPLEVYRDDLWQPLEENLDRAPSLPL